MKDQLLLLLELQQIDSRVHEVRASMQALPEKLAPEQRDLAKLEQMLSLERERLTETESWRKDQEELLRQEEDAVKRAKIKVQAAKNTRDFAAASREVDNHRRSITEREEEVLKVIEALEKNKSGLEDHNKDVESLRAALKEKEEELASRIAELEAEAKEQSAGRDDIVAQIDAQIMKRYATTLKARGHAVAPVEGDTCRGCHMSVPPNLANTVERMTSIETCPRCKSILYPVSLTRSDETENEAE